MPAATGHQPRTHDRVPDGSWQQGLSRATLVLAALGVVLIVATAWATSVPGGYFVDLLGIAAGWLLVGLCWLVVTVATLIVDGRAGRIRQRRRGYWRLALAPLLAVGTVLLAGSTPAPAERVRFALDQDDLEAYAAKVRAGQADAGRGRPTRRIGTLPVTSVEDRDGCVSFTVDGSGFLSYNGYAHCLGDPPEDSSYSFIRITGNWYEWSFTD
jgi:hypothetical protein